MRFVKATGLCCCCLGRQALPAATSQVPEGEDERASPRDGEGGQDVRAPARARMWEGVLKQVYRQTDRCNLGQVDRESKSTRKMGKKTEGEREAAWASLCTLTTVALPKGTSTKGCAPLAWQYQPTFSLPVAMSLY